jgi:hypothetical protein
MEKPAGITFELHRPEGMGWREHGDRRYKKTMLIEFDGAIELGSEQHERIRDYAYEKAGLMGNMEILILRRADEPLQ